MLPEGFEWTRDSEGADLWLNGQRVAFTVQLTTGKHRTCLNPLQNHLRYVFPPDEAAAVRYIERWAVKWKARLRELYPPDGPAAFRTSQTARPR